VSKVQETLSEMAKNLYSVGAIDKTTLRRFDINSLPPVKLQHSDTGRFKPRRFCRCVNVSDRAVNCGNKAKPNQQEQRCVAVDC